MKKLFETYYPLLPIIALCGFYLYQASGFVLHDFANYYFGGYFLSEGHFTSDLYFPDIFNEKISALGYTSVFTSFAPNTPFLALFFYPFHILDPYTAKIIFNLISSVLFIYSLRRIFQHYSIQPIYLVLVPFLFFIPIKNNLLFGQLYFLLFFLLAEGWLAYKKKQLFRMSLFWGIAILLKIFPALLILFLLFRKKFKAALYLIGVCAGLTLLSVAISGFEIWFFFLKDVFPKASNGEIATAFVDNYQSFYMFTKRLLLFDPVENPNPLWNSPLFFKIVWITFKLSLLYIGFYCSQNRNKLFAFSFWIMASILFSPYGSTYTFILLLFPFIFLARERGTSSTKIVLLLLLFAICNAPLSLFLTKAFPFSYIRLAFVVLFFVLFLFPERKTIYRKGILLLPIIIIPIGFVGSYSQPTENSKALLPKDSPILIYEYTVSDNELRYFYRDENGTHTTVIPLPETEIAKADIQNNQIFYNGKQQTLGKDHKQKAIVLNNKTILYLSDYGRGIGFYTLRKTTVH
ncbi:glycosyltransferase family 87 protein [Flavobacterium sp.]|uniref:glycosyltransferase family 87 protein n=1 Tax=Flavobacterium sp. TaxID=239 RepID=UPI002603F2BC|nr:glycosyltransferase family 87 protein [Flavobacterium sp.]